MFAGFVGAITCQINYILLRVDAKVIVGKRTDDVRHAGDRDAKGAKIAVLKIGIGLHVDARQQRGRETAGTRALSLLDPRPCHQNAKIGLEPLLNRVLEGESIRSLLPGCSSSD